MKFLKTMIMTVLMLTAAIFAAAAVSAAEVNSDEELLKALRDENTDTITINYRNANLYEFVTVDRNLTINGNGAVLTAHNGACATFTQGTSLKLGNIVLTGDRDFAIKTYGSVELSGTVEFAGGYGLLLNNGSAVSSSGSVVSRTENRIAIAANPNGGEVSIAGLSIDDTTTAGTLLYIYRGNGTVSFSGTNAFRSSYGSAVIAAAGSSAEQKIVIAAHGKVTAEAPNSKDSDKYGAAFNVRECVLEMKKGASLSAKGSFGAVYCDSLRTEEDCVISAENSIYNTYSGAVTVFGKVTAAPTVSVGNKNSLTLRGGNGLVIFGCSTAAIGNGSTVVSEIRAGDTIISNSGKIVLGDNVTVNSVSDGRGISSKGSFICGADCDITLMPNTSVSQKGIDSRDTVEIGSYSVIKCKAAGIAVDADAAVTFADYATLDCEKVGKGIETMKGVQTGKGCMIRVKDAEKFGVYATGTMLADTVSFGENTTVSISGSGTALYAAEAVIFNKGCEADIDCGDKTPAVWIDTELTTQGYLRITGSAVSVKSALTAKSGTAAVNVVGSVIVEDGSRLTVESEGAFGFLGRAGDLIIGTKSTVCTEGGCGAFVEDGNIRISQGGALCAKGTLDSGVRVSNGMLRAGEGSTIITEGERFGAEILIAGGIWLDNPALFDLRSTKSAAIYIENGVFSAANTKKLSAWYGKEGVDNVDTWWNADVSGMKAWEINTKLSEDELCYADYTQNNVNGTVNYKNAAAVSSEGFEANVGVFSAGAATRISAFKTRPVGTANYLFIPSGRSFSWRLEADSTEGEGEIFTLVDKPASGTVTLSEKGLLSYTAPASTRGEQVLTYTVTAKDGAKSLPVQVIINVTRSKPPAACNHTFEVQANGSLFTSVSATDFDGVIASLTVTEEPKHGTVSIGSDGKLMYTPEGTYMGLDSFRYVATDNDSDRSNEATVTLLVGIRGETTAANKTYIAAKNEETAGKFSVSLSKGELLEHIEITDYPEYGTLTAEGLNFVYTPPENFAGTETFSYIAVTENGIKSNEAFISIITVPSEKPKSNSLKLDCASGKGYSGKLSAEDLDGNISTFMVETYPQHGTLDFDASNGRFTYTAESGYTGTDSFSFYVYDDEGLKSEVAVVSISVDTYLNMLKASGELTKIILFGSLAVAAVIVLIVIIVTGTIRKHRKQDREYEEQYGNDPYDGYYY